MVAVPLVGAPALPDVPGVAVLAPALLTSVTIESAPDAGADIHVHPAGQGYWVARMLAALGSPVRLCCTAGGELGAVASAAMDPGIELRLAASAGRSGGYVDDRRSGRRERLAETCSAPLDRHAVDDLVSVTMAAGMEAGLVVLTGSNLHGTLPPETYGSLARNLRKVGVRVVADLSGDELAEALAGGLDVVKVSHEELTRDGYARGDDADAVVQGAVALAAAGADLVCVTMGADGAVLVADRNGEVARARGPRLEAVDPRGAGDSFTAGMALGVRRGLPQHGWLRLGVAAATVNVTRHGLGSGERVAVERLTELVEVEP